MRYIHSEETLPIPENGELSISIFPDDVILLRLRFVPGHVVFVGRIDGLQWRI